MSGVSILRKLLDGVGVEWKTIGEVTSVLRGKRLTKNQLSEGATFPVYHGGLEPLGCYTESNRPGNTVMVINVGASAGTVGYSTKDFWSSDGCFCLEHSDILNNRYLYFILIGHQNLLRSKVRVAGIPTLDSFVIEKIEVPIPCPENPQRSREIQAEIVRILDTFTELTGELTAELTARKKQYNYYRDQLLSFEDGEVEWKPLGEVAKILNGYAFKSSMYCESGVRVIRISDVQKGQMSDANPKYYPNESVDEIRKYLLEEGDLVMSLTGNAGRVAMLSKSDLPAGLNQRVACIRPISDAVTTRYLFHFLNQDCFENDAMANATGGGQKNMSTTWLASYLIPVPSPKVQSRIVEMLDRFDSLTGSTTEGLPREIELRQKQYEYYRNLLLSFPKPESAIA